MEVSFSPRKPPGALGKGFTSPRTRGEGGNRSGGFEWRRGVRRVREREHSSLLLPGRLWWTSNQKASAIESRLLFTLRHGAEVEKRQLGSPTARGPCRAWCILGALASRAVKNLKLDPPTAWSFVDLSVFHNTRLPPEPSDVQQ